METAIPFFRNRERVRGKDNEYPKLKNANEISMFDVGHWLMWAPEKFRVMKAKNMLIYE